MNKEPFISIILCTYNGGEKISECLRTLSEQGYPQDKYEIIVVDDASVDNTPEIVAGFPVKLIRHSFNQGAYGSRNTGMRVAIGEIVVFVDDDCYYYKDWLTKLIEPYHQEGVVAVGCLTLASSNKYLTEKYMAETGYGNPSPKGYSKSDNPLYRFFVYLQEMLRRPDALLKGYPIEVAAIYANSSFKKDVLEKLGGWDAELRYGGDSEMCMRINKEGVGKIMFTSTSKVLHKHATSFLSFLKGTYKRSINRYLVYKKYKMFPPIFPFPIVVIVSIVLISFFDFRLFVPALVLIPQAVYIWWPILFFKRFRWYFLPFPYMQLSLEFAMALGMLRGYLK